MVRRLIRHIDWVVTLDAERRMIADGAIAIADSRIELIGKSDEVEHRFQADETIDGRTLIAIPGLIDTNVATIAQLGRGAADFCDIPKFMLERILPYEAALSADDAEIAARACQLEMIRSGTTCFVDAGSRYPEVVAGIAHETGLRALVSRAAYDVFDTIMGAFPQAFARETTQEAVRRAEDAIGTIEKLGDARVRAAVALPWLAAASDGLCRELSELARQKQVRLVVAAARSRDDAVAARRQHGRTEVKRLLDADALHAATIVAHAGWTSPRDLVDLQRHRLVAAGPQITWRLEGPEGPVIFKPHTVLETNSSEVVREAVVSGLGIGFRSTWDVSAELKRGVLKRVMPAYGSASDVNIYAVYSGRRLVPVKVRAFVDYLVGVFGPEEPYWDREIHHILTREVGDSSNRTARPQAAVNGAVHERRVP